MKLSVTSKLTGIVLCWCCAATWWSQGGQLVGLGSSASLQGSILQFSL